MFRKTYDLITIGGATRDIMFYTDESRLISTPEDLCRQKLIGFEYGAKILPTSVHFTSGGGGNNTAVSFRRLGLKTATFLRVGMDRDAEELVALLHEERVDTRFIERDSRHPTGFTFMAIDNKTGEHVAFLCRGANDHMLMSQAELRRTSTRWFYLSSISAPSWPKTVRNLTGYLAARPRVKLGWNPGQLQLQAGRKKLQPLLRRASAFIVNLDEATELVISDRGGKQYVEQNPWSLAKTIQQWGPAIVAITNGEQGAYVFDGQKRYREKAVGVKALDTTGAGDAFGSTFVAGLLLFQGDIRRALRLALINSGSVVSQLGPQAGLLRRPEITARFRKIFHEEI